MPKLNCWEFKKCGREPGGENVTGHGVCPAATNERLDGVHRGKKAGRVCWIIAGTMCGGEIQGTFAGKYKDCRECDFYQRVKEEEGSMFLVTIELINKLSRSNYPA
jgi:hypothetical protein